MDTYYGYTTAIWYWRIAAPRNVLPSHVHRSPRIDDYANTDAREQAHRPNWLDPALLSCANQEIHLIIFHRQRRTTRESAQRHLWETPPRDSFAPAGEGSFVSSPEFTFLQMASMLDFHELVLLGMELCGYYAIDPTEEEGFGKRIEPLTSCERIGAFLEQAKGTRGYRAACTALRYMADGSASPMESAIYLALCLPCKRGGYGLPKPSLNHPIDLNDDARKLTSNRRCWGDLCWPDDMLDLEYLGVASHEGSAKMLADRGRTLAIEEMGYEVVEVTKDQALDPEAFEVIARRIATRLGKRLRNSDLGSTPERLHLHHAAHRWHDARGRHPVEEPAADETSEVVFGRMAE